MRRDATAARRRAVAKLGRRRCSAKLCEPRADRMIRSRRAPPAFQFKRTPPRRRAAADAAAAEIERRRRWPTVWTARRTRGVLRLHIRICPCCATALRRTGERPARPCTRATTIGSRRSRAPRRPDSASGYRRADATLACRFMPFSLTRRIRPHAASRMRPRPDPPRSPSAHVRPDCWPTRHAHLENMR